MKSFLRVACITLALTAASAVRSASAVEFDTSPSSQSRAVVNAVFRDYIGTLVGAQIETAVVDINSDGIGEIIARFVHSSSCRDGAKKCRTVMIRHNADKWGIVLDTYADKIDVPKTEKFIFSVLDIDGLKWKWNSLSYAPLIESAGEKITFSPVPAEMMKSLGTAFGPGAVKAIEAGNLGIWLEFSKPNLGAKDEYLLVRMKGATACGDLAGCPVRLLQKIDNAWQTILEAGAVGDVVISRISRDGHRDIVFGTKKGFVSMGWSGKYYALAETVESVAAPK